MSVNLALTMLTIAVGSSPSIIEGMDLSLPRHSSARITSEDKEKLLKATGTKGVALQWRFPDRETSSSLRFKPMNLFSTGARIVVVDKGKWSQIPIPNKTYFLGFDESGQPSAWISLDADSSRIDGVVVLKTSAFRIQDIGGREKSSNLRLSSVSPRRGLRCGVECEATKADVPAGRSRPGSRKNGERPLFLAKIAVDTDNEFNFYAFDNDAEAAAAWIADIFASVNVTYRRDHNVGFQLGDIILRRDTDPVAYFDDDPWPTTDSLETILGVFTNWWEDHMQHIDREFATIFSGQRGKDASGIAWGAGLCQQVNRYSATRAASAYDPALSDLVSHEIGHNFQLSHTHCYVPAVDHCWNQEAGCYDGPKECPPGGAGTVMSYCGFQTPAGTCTISTYFHSVSRDWLDFFLSAAIDSGCLRSRLIFSDGFEGGEETEWSNTTP